MNLILNRFATVACLVCSSLVLIVSPSFSEEKAGQEKKRELPQTGVLSGTGGGAAAGVAMEGPWGGTSLEGKDSGNPIGGSVSRLSDRDWVAKVANSSEDRYRVTVAVVQYDERNRRLKSDTFSLSLQPKETVERPFRANPSTSHSMLELKSWKRFPKQKTADELKKEIENKKKEMAELEQQLKALGK